MSSWKIEPTVYGDGYKEYYIYQKIFGLFWIKRFTQTIFLSPFDGGRIGGYNSLLDAKLTLSHKLGPEKYYKLGKAGKIHIYSAYEPHVEERFYMMKTSDGFVVSKGIYAPKGAGETFTTIAQVIKCDTAKEALMKADLMGIKIDNRNRFVQEE